MDNKKFLNRLERMKGKTFQYANQIHYIEWYRIDEVYEKCTIKTNLKQFERNYESMDEFLTFWTPANSVQSLVPIPDDQALQIYREQEESQAARLIAILEDNITKVQTNPNYIAQAMAINTNINSIIKIQKMKMEFIKSARKGK